jgi:protein ImuB
MPTTSRIACLRIPDFPIAAHRRAEGEAPDPAIVVRGEGKTALVAAACEAARRHEIEVGMRAADARAQLPGLREWEWSPALYDEVQTELAAALLAASPRVSRAGLGAFWLDAGGWDRLGGEAAFVEAACSAALAAGYPEARLGIAGTAAAARAATRLDGYPVHRVPPGEDARFLAPLPLDVLPLSEELFELLAALGLETVGELAALDAGGVEARLGAAGVAAHRWARGLDDGREGPFAGAPPGDWTVEVELPGPVERLEPLLFLLKSCLDHLGDALAVEGLCLRGLKLTITTEDGSVEKTVRPARPTRQVAMLLSLCRTALDGVQVPGRALGIRVEVEEVVPAVAEQADLFEPPRPDPDALAAALTRLQGRWGPESVVQPAAVDSHRPEKQGRWEPVDLMKELARRVVLEGNGCASLSSETPSLVLRLWPRPRPLDVRIEDGRPGAVVVDGGWRAVEELKGPERLSGEWWEDGYRREYYRVGTVAGDLLWVFYDPRRRGWFWHGWWD